MKKIFVLLLATAMIFALAACGATPNGTDNNNTQDDHQAETPDASYEAPQITELYNEDFDYTDGVGNSGHYAYRVPQIEADTQGAEAINKAISDAYTPIVNGVLEDVSDKVSLSCFYVAWESYQYENILSLVVSCGWDADVNEYNVYLYDIASGQQLTVAEVLQRMGLDPDEVQQQVQRQAMQAFDREMAQGAYYEGLRLGGELSQMRMDTLEYNELENLCLLLPQQDQLVLRGKYSCEEGWQQLDMELSLPPADTPVLTDTYDGVQVQLEGTQATITLSPAPKTDQWGDIGIRVEQEHSYPILGAYNEYVDVCIGEQEDGFFRPVVYLLTKDGVVEYVDVLRCLISGNALVCQDPIYIANQGVALERSGSEVNLRREDGSVLELAPLTAEWNAQELPYEVTGAFNDMGDDQFDWMDVESNGSVQMGVQDNSVFYHGYADYLGVVPEGMVLGVWTNETADGAPGITFVAAMKYDLYNETLTLTMLNGQNPFAEGKTQLQLIRCPDN